MKRQPDPCSDPEPANPHRVQRRAENAVRTRTFRQPSVGTLLFGAVCVIAVVFWIVQSEVPAKVFISSWSVVIPGILLLSVFLALRRFVPNVLTRQRLLLMYAMTSASSCLVGYGSLQAMYPAVATQFYNASPSNHWDKFNRYIPTWLAPRSQDVLKGLYVGHTPVPWKAWAIPMLAWGTIWSLIALAMLSLAVLLAPGWIHEERLTFPIVQLPLEMTTDRVAFFRSGTFWIGFAIPLIAESLLAIQYYIPTVPAVQMKHVDYSPLFKDPPWNALAPFYFGFTPFIVGFAYLAPTDISFSIFFFAILDRLVQVLTVALGGDPASVGAYLKQPPFSQQQTIGAFLAFAALPLWRGRRRGVARVRNRENRVEKSAVAGLAIASLVLLAIFQAAGLSLPVAAAVIVLLLLFGVALARIRAESGAVWAFGPYGGLAGNLVNSLGTAHFSAAELSNLSTMQWMSADMRFLPMPFHMESLKIGDTAGISRARMCAALAFATVLGVGTGLAAILWIEYQLGVATGKVYGGVSYWQQLVTARSTYWTSNHTDLDLLGIPWMVVGAVITLGLSMLRQNLLWWPLNPVGYVLAHTGTGLSFWAHYLIAWILKSLTLRYGGMPLYRKSIPLVVGFILGDILTQTAWSAGAVLLGAPVYQFIS